MKKTIVLIFLLMLLALQAAAQYKRKIIEPEFFMPESVQLHQQEKLPELKLPEKEIKKEPVKAENSLIDIKETPSYKFKYSEYIKDIITFYNTGKMPENNKLDSDLKAMNSDKHIELTTPNPTKITSKEMGEFYNIYKKAMED